MNRKQEIPRSTRLMDKRRDAWSKGWRGFSPWFWVSVLVAATVLAAAAYVYFSLLNVNG